MISAANEFCQSYLGFKLYADAKPAPDEIAEYWDSRVTFVHPITALAVVVLMDALEPGSKVITDDNKVEPQKYADYTIFNTINWMWISRTFANVQGDKASSENLHIGMVALPLVHRWFSYDKQQLSAYRQELNDINLSQSRQDTTQIERKIRHLETLTQEHDKFLQLCLNGYDKLSKTYEEKSPNTVGANRDRQREIKDRFTSPISETIVLSDVERTLKDMWCLVDFQQFNTSIDGIGQYPPGDKKIKASLNTPLKLIEAINKLFQSFMNNSAHISKSLR